MSPCTFRHSMFLHIVFSSHLHLLRLDMCFQMHSMNLPNMWLLSDFRFPIPRPKQKRHFSHNQQGGHHPTCGMHMKRRPTIVPMSLNPLIFLLFQLFPMPFHRNTNQNILLYTLHYHFLQLLSYFSKGCFGVSCLSYELWTVVVSALFQANISIHQHMLKICLTYMLVGLVRIQKDSSVGFQCTGRCLATTEEHC